MLLRNQQSICSDGFFLFLYSTSIYYFFVEQTKTCRIFREIRLTLMFQVISGLQNKTTHFFGITENKKIKHWDSIGLHRDSKKK